ncbi:hypothetical protein [Bacillus subtilis]|uniref:hypothetical protein n=1 Tax=Bacillus subtilis TaxID=1423 RepID=UPI00249C61E0|nr:hypothetical protein [Bacillus subtilis]
MMWQLKKEIDARHPGANQLQLKKRCCRYRKPGAACRDVAAEERDRCQASRSEPAAAEEKMLPVPETRKPGAAVSVMRAAEEDQCLEL